MKERRTGSLRNRHLWWSTLRAHYPGSEPTSSNTPGRPRDVDGKDWRVRLNDFPDDFMYSLVIEGTTIHNFHDWPAAWLRD